LEPTGGGDHVLGPRSDAGIPVVGTTGLRIDEYSEPWVFPVSTATISIMRIMAKYAYEQEGARTFGIVYDSKYKFGLEGKDAFVNYLDSLGDAEVKAVQPLDPDQSSYGTQAQKFNQECGNDDGQPDCDMVALLLGPETAQK
jgi:ABC-type branched-subunit amino acid transport system substrate-binding protein